MSKQTKFTDTSTNLAELCDRVVANRDVVIITQQETESVALIAADELDSLLTALERAKARILENRVLTAYVKS